MLLYLLPISAIYFVNAAVNDFRIGIQVYDGNPGQNVGSERWTPWALDGGGWSLWAGDNDYHDPDGAKVAIQGRENPSYSSTYIEDIDIRIGIQSSDWLDCNSCGQENGNSDREGQIQYTRWATEGGGWVQNWASTRYGGDLDGWRIAIDTRSSPGLLIDNIQIGLQVTDANGDSDAGTPQYTQALNAGTTFSWSGWASDSNAYDPDQAKIYLSATVWTREPTSNPTPSPTNHPTPTPTNNPTPSPTNDPTPTPTDNPTPSPTNHPTPAPTDNPTKFPTNYPTKYPTKYPSDIPTLNPTLSPSVRPTASPTLEGKVDEETTVVIYSTQNGFKSDTDDTGGFLENNSLIIICALSGLLLCCCMAFLICFCRHRRKEERKKGMNAMNEMVAASSPMSDANTTVTVKDGEGDGVELTTPQNVQTNINMMEIVDSMPSGDEDDMDGFYDSNPVTQGMDEDNIVSNRNDQDNEDDEYEYYNDDEQEENDHGAMYSKPTNTGKTRM